MNDDFYSHIPEDQAQQLIKHAATISGNPAAEMTIQEAVKILEERGIKMPTYNPAIDKAAAMLWATMDTRQLKRILSANDADLENAFSSVIEELAQKAQEAMPAQDAQEVKIFDAKVWEDAAGNYAEIRRALNDRTLAAMDPVKEILTGTVADISKAAREALATITEIANSPAYKAIKEKLQEAGRIIEEYRLNYKELAEASEELEQLIPFLQMEIDAAQDDQAFSGCTLEEVLDKGFSADLQPIDSKYRALIDRAMQQLEEHRRLAETVAEIEQAAEELPRINYHNSKQAKTVTDKLMNFFYSLDAPTPKGIIDGQRAMLPLKYENSKSKNEITLWFDYEYDDAVLSRNGVPKGFSGFDYFVATTLDNLKESGNNKVSYSKILDEMGIDPAQKNIEKLAKALIKGATTTIFVDDSEVQKAWGNKNYHEIISRVLPITIGNERAIANGFVTDGIIEIDNFSPFRRLAGDLKHLTQWKKEIFLLYKGRKTERYWNVLQVLIREIGWMRNSDKRKPKISYKLFYIQNGDKTPRDKQNTRAMIYRLLEEVFLPAGYVKSFREDNSTDPGVHVKVVRNSGLLPE